ncbi:MAG TPA: HAD family hydrolase [Planctomycetaceae bacterium]|nr:HAD family hydrolase [Planctomycetaceae bacterium]
MEDRHLLISDVDGTLLGDDRALQKFVAWYEEHRDRLRLVYNSGRLVSSIVESIETTNLPAPDAIIGGVGTQIREYPSNDEIGQWPAQTRSWQPLIICGLLAEYPELELQPPEFLAEYKISYYVADAPAELLSEIRGRLEQIDCPVDLIYSSHRDLDVLPRGVNKGTASAYLASYWSIPESNVFVSGDTGNDLELFNNGFRGIVVGNAHPELKSLNSDLIYQARQSHAAGVQEGLSYWFNQ